MIKKLAVTAATVAAIALVVKATLVICDEIEWVAA